MQDEDVKNNPWTALAYYSEGLTPEQFDFCVRACPSYALAYFADKLTEEQKKYCKEKTK